MTARATMVIAGRIVVAAEGGALESAQAIGIADGRVVAVGERSAVLRDAASRARIVDAGDGVVVPGLHDFHIHLVGLARQRRAVDLDGAEDLAEVAERLRAAAAGRDEGWITGRGWNERQLGGRSLAPLEAAVGGRPAFLDSHDGHSAWASATARRLAGLSAGATDPPGGRIERDEHGEPTGILRETAMDLVDPIVERLQGDRLREPLGEALAELASLGVTGASEAGDYTAENGIGPDAALGDSYSTLTDLADVLDARMRMNIGIPADAIAAAAERGLRTGMRLAGRRTLRFGWAKEYADGALGSGTAALFTPRTCGDDRDAGILRVGPEELDALFAAARAARIGMAVHAIGDRAAATVLDAAGRAPFAAAGVPRDRMEHVQLIRAADRTRLADLGITASVQPIHAAADRDLVESCWDGRQDDAYAWRSVLDAGALLAAGSDAPVESVNPWLGIFAAVHRRSPDDARGDWRPSQAMSVAQALGAYTLGPALAAGIADEGHLRVGARADLALLDIGLDTLMAADERLADARSLLTLVDGREVHRS